MELTANGLVETCTKLEELIVAAMLNVELTWVQIPMVTAV